MSQRSNISFFLKAIAFAGLMTGISSAHAFQFRSFCGQIRGLHFYEDANHRVRAFAYLDNLKDSGTHKKLLLKKVTLTDAPTVFHISKAVAKSSIQNSDQLQKDLKGLDFHWDKYVGEEQAPNPYEEDFVVCITADLDRVDSEYQLPAIQKLDDIFHDGYSIKDLTQVDLP